MKNLSAEVSHPFDRLIWLCEGLLGLHTPALPEHRAMERAAKAGRKFALAREWHLALVALETVEGYVEDDADERASVKQRVEACRAVVTRRQ